MEYPSIFRVSISCRQQPGFVLNLIEKMPDGLIHPLFGKAISLKNRVRRRISRCDPGHDQKTRRLVAET